MGYAQHRYGPSRPSTRRARADWNDSELAFQSAYTNRTFIETEGSRGIHNWDYARTVILKALDQAKSVKSAVVDVTISSPLVTTVHGTASLKYGQSTTDLGQGRAPGGRRLRRPCSAARSASGSSRPAAQLPADPADFLSGPAFDEYLFTVMPARSGTYSVEFVGNDDMGCRLSAETIGLTSRTA